MPSLPGWIFSSPWIMWVTAPVRVSDWTHWFLRYCSCRVNPFVMSLGRVECHIYSPIFKERKSTIIDFRDIHHTVKPVSRDYWNETPCVVKGYIFLQKVLHFKITEPVTKNHLSLGTTSLWQMGMVVQEIFNCKYMCVVGLQKKIRHRSISQTLEYSHKKSLRADCCVNVFLFFWRILVYGQLSTVPCYSTASDWEAELHRQKARGFRVTSLNHGYHLCGRYSCLFLPRRPWHCARMGWVAFQ